MTSNSTLNPGNLPVAVIIGATTKWHATGQNTLYSHGAPVDDSAIAAEIRWGMGGALALKFAREGFFTVLTTRRRSNAEPLAAIIRQRGGACLVMELDVADEAAIATAFAEIRRQAGEPEIVIYNVGYFYGRDLPPEMEFLERLPIEIYDKAQLLVGRGPLLVAQQVLPQMRARGTGSIFFSNNPSCLGGRRRRTGESLYYPRVMQRALAQVLVDEYTAHGIHAANIIIAGIIDSPGTRTLDMAKEHPDAIVSPIAIADTFFRLHREKPSEWTFELQITPSGDKPVPT